MPGLRIEQAGVVPQSERRRGSIDNYSWNIVKNESAAIYPCEYMRFGR